MFKKFYVYTGIFSLIVSLVFSASNIPPNEYFYPIKNNKRISSFYGVRKLHGRYHFHNGIDIPAVPGTPVYSINNGIVKYIGFDTNGYGNYIIILHANSYKSLYGHLSNSSLVNLGERVTKGQIISHIGPKFLSNGKLNGYTTGPHLHFSVFTNDGKTIDPLTLEYNK